MTSQHPPAQDGDLASAAEELYALSPGDFTAARDEWVARARTSGNWDLARAIGALPPGGQRVAGQPAGPGGRGPGGRTAGAGRVAAPGAKGPGR